MGRHVENAVMHGGREAVMDLALRGSAGSARVIHHLIEIEKIVEGILRLVVASQLHDAARHSLGARSRINTAVRPDRKRPAGIGHLVLGELIPFHLIVGGRLGARGASRSRSRYAVSRVKRHPRRQ